MGCWPTTTSESAGRRPSRFVDKFEHRAGLDAKFVAKDSVTFDVTLNPDFSQVESDDPQLTVNQRFAVFFPESGRSSLKMRGSLRRPINLFFSRRIADPQFGTRVTGKLGKWTLGALVIDDRRPGQGFTSGPYNTRAADGVVRVTREFGNQSYIGGFFSSRDFADTSNRVASLDARLKFSKNWVVDVQGVHSWTRQDLNAERNCLSFASMDPAIGSQQGNALWADASYSGRHFSFSTYYNDFSPNFCTELGFVNRIDIRQNFANGAYLWRPEKSKIIDFGPSFSETVTGTTPASCRTGARRSAFRSISPSRRPSASAAERHTNFSKISVSGSTARHSWCRRSRTNGSPSPRGTRKESERIFFRRSRWCHFSRFWEAQSA